MKYFGLLILTAASLFAISGCGESDGPTRDEVGLRADVALPLRNGTVVVDGCSLDTWQHSTLTNPSTKKVLQNGKVIFLCLVPRADGTIGPRDPSSLAGIAALADDLRKEGYQMYLGVSFTTETGERYDGGQTAAWLAQADWRAQFVKTLPDAIGAADGVDIDFQNMVASSENDVDKLIAAVSKAIRPAKKLEVFIAPSVQSPSDIPGGDAVSPRDLAALVDRMHISTLDFSAEPGPTIDPGWAIDAVRFAGVNYPNLDISYPLYGTDFGPHGVRSVSYAEAIATGARVQRGPTGAPFVDWTGFGGEHHETWFDDAESTGLALGAWTPQALPDDIGIVFWGLGAEDPTLWDRLAARMP